MDGEKEKLKKQKYNNFYMEIAERVAKMSYAKRLQVGSVLVKNDNIISFGWNGMPSGWINDCEDENFKTKPEVLHSETNCISKLAKIGQSSNGATMFITHAPCLDCAKLIYQSGINSVYYRNAYRSDDGIEFLKKCKLDVNNV